MLSPEFKNEQLDTKRKNKRSKKKRNNKCDGNTEQLSTNDQQMSTCILDFVNEGNINEHNKELLEETIKSLNEWYESGEQIKF